MVWKVKPMWNSFKVEIREISTLQSKQQAQYTVDGMLLLLLRDANNTLNTEAVHKFGKNGNNKIKHTRPGTGMVLGSS